MASHTVDASTESNKSAEDDSKHTGFFSLGCPVSSFFLRVFCSAFN